MVEPEAKGFGVFGRSAAGTNQHMRLDVLHHHNNHALDLIFVRGKTCCKKTCFACSRQDIGHAQVANRLQYTTSYQGHGKNSSDDCVLDAHGRVSRPQPSAMTVMRESKSWRKDGMTVGATGMMPVEV